MKKILFAFAGILVLFAACKKDPPASDPPVTPPTDTTKAVSKYAALTTDKWRVAEVYMLKGSDTVVEYYSSMEECEKDNFIFFNTNGSITSDEGATKCDPTVAQVTTDGSWVLSSDTTKFTIKESSILPIEGDVSAKIVTLNNSYFKISKDTAIMIGTATIDGTIYAAFKKVK